MLTTELLITYGFERVSSTPLEKWCFENLVLFVENINGFTCYRISDANFSSITLYIRTETDLQNILKIVDEGGSISSIASKDTIGSNWELLNRTMLQEFLDKWKN
jgi:hypothetical protein